MSGCNCLRTVVREDCNWWYLSNLLFEEQGLCHVQLVFRDQVVYKCHYNQAIVQEDFPPVDENILLDTPKKTKSATSTPAKKKPAAASKVLKKPATTNIVQKMVEKKIPAPKNNVAKKPAKRSK